jgi:hypothetical protein
MLSPLPTSRPQRTSDHLRMEPVLPAAHARALVQRPQINVCLQSVRPRWANPSALALVKAINDASRIPALLPVSARGSARLNNFRHLNVDCLARIAELPVVRLLNLFCEPQRRDASNFR